MSFSVDATHCLTIPYSVILSPNRSFKLQDNDIGKYFLDSRKCNIHNIYIKKRFFSFNKTIQAVGVGLVKQYDILVGNEKNP